MQKRVLANGAGVYEDGNWHANNLKFLVEFMNRLGLSTSDVAERVGLTKGAVIRWLKVDDTSLSKIDKLAESCGYEFQIYYSIPMPVDEHSDITIDPITPANENFGIHSKRLAFLRRAMQIGGVTNQQLADDMSLSRNSIQHWIRQDDMTFRYIYQIARTYGWKVKIRFKANAQ